jgi:hypothetical protein
MTKCGAEEGYSTRMLSIQRGAHGAMYALYTLETLYTLYTLDTLETLHKHTMQDTLAVTK